MNIKKVLEILFPDYDAVQEELYAEKARRNAFRTQNKFSNIPFLYSQMQEIDAMVDDGNLGSGQFRQRPGGYIYILEE